MAESSGGALRQLFASLVFQFDGATLQRANTAVDAAKTRMGELQTSFRASALTARQRLGAAVGNVTGWSSAIQTATKQAASGVKASAGIFDMARGAVTKYIAGFAVVKLYEFGEANIEAAEQTYRLSKRVGTSFEDLQKIGKFLAPAGVQVQQLQRPLVTLAKNLTKAAETGKGPAAAAFKELGISIQKGSSPQMLDTFYQLAGALGELEDDTKRTTLAQRLLGNQGVALLPAFEGNREAVAKMRAEIEASGVAMSEEFGRSSEKIAMANRKMQGAMKALKIQAVTMFMPIWRGVAEGISKAVTVSIKFVRGTQLMQTVVGVFAAQYLRGKLVGALAAAIVKFGGLTKALTALNLALGAAVAKFALIALAALIFEDIAVAIQGGEGATKDLIEALVGVDEAKQVLADLKAWWDEFGADVKRIGGNVAKFFGETLLGVLSLIGMVFSKSEASQDRWTAAFLRNTKAISSFFDAMFKPIFEAFDWLEERWDWFTGAVEKLTGIQLGGGSVDEGPKLRRFGTTTVERAVPRTAESVTSNNKSITLIDQRELNVTTTASNPAEVKAASKALTSTLDLDRASTAAAFGM